MQRQLEGEPIDALEATKYPTPIPRRTAEAVVDEVSQIDPGSRPPGDDIHTGGDPEEDADLQTSPPPPNPEEAAELQRLRSEVGGLRDELGKRTDAHKQQLKELELRMKMATGAHPQAQRPAPMQLPPELNAEDNPTWGQINAVLGQVIPNVQAVAQAQAIRSVWDVTPAEEMAVLQEYPHLTQAEPERTRLIQEAALLKRPPKEAPAPPAPASVSTVAPPEVPERPLGKTVPMRETEIAQIVADAPPTSEIALAQAEYDAASRIKDQHERLTARKTAWKKLLALTGQTTKSVFETPFKQE
jgi:hypothetical protein